jgi:hypothetical protein|tara:strand:- start:336 stop:497 length:162 start_codon:yes stop_codon:yes gene_type:complete
MKWFDLLKKKPCCSDCADGSKHDDAKKAAGAVTSATPGIHRVRYSPKREEEEE